MTHAFSKQEDERHHLNNALSSIELKAKRATRRNSRSVAMMNPGLTRTSNSTNHTKVESTQSCIMRQLRAKAS